MSDSFYQCMDCGEVLVRPGPCPSCGSEHRRPSTARELNAAALRDPGANRFGEALVQMMARATVIPESLTRKILAEVRDPGLRVLDLMGVDLPEPEDVDLSATAALFALATSGGADDDDPEPEPEPTPDQGATV